MLKIKNKFYLSLFIYTLIFITIDCSQEEPLNQHREDVLQCFSTHYNIDLQSLNASQLQCIFICNKHNNTKDEIDLVEQCIADANLPHNFLNSMFMFACAQGNIELIDFLLKKGVNINASNNDKATGLMYACGRNKTKAVAFLLEQKANLELLNKKEASAFMYACYHGASETVKFLAENFKIDINQLCASETAFIVACKKGLEKTASFLLKKYGSTVDINRNDKNGYTSLMQACIYNDEKIATLLLGSPSIDTTKRSKSGKSALDYACIYNPDLVKLFLKNNHDPKDPFKTHHDPKDILETYYKHVPEEKRDKRIKLLCDFYHIVNTGRTIDLSH